MSELSKRSTVYFAPEIHHALRLKAATAQLSLSEVVNEAVRLALREDQEDLAALFFYERLPGAGILGGFTIAWNEILGSLWRKVRG